MKGEGALLSVPLLGLSLSLGTASPCPLREWLGVMHGIGKGCRVCSLGPSLAASCSLLARKSLHGGGLISPKDTVF